MIIDNEIKVIALLSGYIRELNELNKDFEEITYKTASDIVKLFNVNKKKILIDYHDCRMSEEVSESRRLLIEVRKHYLFAIDLDTGRPKAGIEELADLWDRINKELNITTIA